MSGQPVQYRFRVKRLFFPYFNLTYRHGGSGGDHYQRNGTFRVRNSRDGQDHCNDRSSCRSRVACKPLNTYHGHGLYKRTCVQQLPHSYA